MAPVLSRTAEDFRAIRIRRFLKLAGITRPRLFETTATTMAVNFRSLRDSGITWLALAGVDSIRMMRRAGHESVSTTLGYVKQAEDVNGTMGEPFGALPEALTGVAIAVGIRAKNGPKSPALPKMPRKGRENSAERAGFERKFTEEVAQIHENLGHSAQARDDVSARELVDDGSVRSTWADGSTANGPSSTETRTEAGFEASGRDASTSPLTLLDELAQVIARAVVEGDLGLATALIDAARRRGRPPAGVGVVGTSEEREDRRQR